MAAATNGATITATSDDIQTLVYIIMDAVKKYKAREARRHAKSGGDGTPDAELAETIKRSIAKKHRRRLDLTRPERVSRARRRKGQENRNERKRLLDKIAALERKLEAALAAPPTTPA